MSVSVALAEHIIHHNRATVAVAHAILKAAYHILKSNTPYKELGPDYFDQRRKAEIVKKSVKRLETFGFTVTIEQSANSSIA